MSFGSFGIIKPTYAICSNVPYDIRTAVELGFYDTNKYPINKDPFNKDRTILSSLFDVFSFLTVNFKQLFVINFVCGGVKSNSAFLESNDS